MEQKEAMTTRARLFDEETVWPKINKWVRHNTDLYKNDEELVRVGEELQDVIDSEIRRQIKSVCEESLQSFNLAYCHGEDPSEILGKVLDGIQKDRGIKP